MQVTHTNLKTIGLNVFPGLYASGDLSASPRTITNLNLTGVCYNRYFSYHFGYLRRSHPRDRSSERRCVCPPRIPTACLFSTPFPVPMSMA